MTSKDKAKKLHEIAYALEEWGEYNEKVTNAAEWDTPEAKQIIRKAMTLLVDNLALLNECKNKYGLHGLLQQCFANIGQAASWPKTKDFGDCRGWCQEFTKRPLWESERRSFADECVRYANEVGKETKQDTKDSGDTYNINAEHVSLGDKAQHAGRDINSTSPEPEKENGRGKLIIILSIIAVVVAILIWLFGDNILGRISKEFKSNKPTVKQIETLNVPDDLVDVNNVVFETRPTAGAIIEEIERLPVFEQKVAAENYIGRTFKWRLRFEFLVHEKGGMVYVLCKASPVRGEVSFNINADTKENLKIKKTKKGKFLDVSGEIMGISLARDPQIRLKDVRLEFVD